MKKEENNYPKFDSLSEAHRAFGSPKPLHPLISLTDNTKTKVEIINYPIPIF